MYPRPLSAMLCTCQVLSFSLCPKPCSLHESSHIKASLSSTRTDETPSHSGRLTPVSCTLDTLHFITTLLGKKSRGAAVLKGHLIYSPLQLYICWYVHTHTHTHTHILTHGLYLLSFIYSTPGRGNNDILLSKCTRGVSFDIKEGKPVLSKHVTIMLKLHSAAPADHLIMLNILTLYYKSICLLSFYVLCDVDECWRVWTVLHVGRSDDDGGAVS